MSALSSIRNSLRKICDADGNVNKPEVYYASVDSVDIPLRTCSCTLISGTADVSLSTVNLMAEVNDGLLRVPTVGSTVYILSTQNVTPWVDVFSELDQIFYVAGGSTFLIDNSGLELNGKEYGGLIQIAALVDKVNRLENVVNGIVDAFVTHTHPTAATGPPSSPTIIPPATMPTDISPITQRSDLENTTVQHGGGS